MRAPVGADVKGVVGPSIVVVYPSDVWILDGITCNEFGEYIVVSREGCVQRQKGDESPKDTSMDSSHQTPGHSYTENTITWRRSPYEGAANGLEHKKNTLRCLLGCAGIRCGEMAVREDTPRLYPLRLSTPHA